MKIFVSHSFSDSELLNQFKTKVEPHGIKLLIAEHIQDSINTISQKIENMIKESEFAIIMLTDNGINSNFVQQEIGYIKSLNKPFFQLVQSGFEDKLSGFSFGRDYILYDPERPEDAINKIKDEILNFWEDKKEKELSIQRKVNFENYQIELKKKEIEENQFKIGLGILALVVVVLIIRLD